MAGHALIVEDDPLAAAILADWLKESGWEVVVVSNVADAMEQVRATTPAVAFVDLVLPGEFDGTDLAAWLRLLPQADGLRLVMMSARADAGERVESLSGGRFLPKPLTREAVTAALEGLPTTAPLPAPAPPEPPAQAPARNLVDHLEELANGRFSGVLLATVGGHRIRVGLRRGNPVWVRTPHTDTGIGAILVDLGALEPAVLQARLATGRATGVPLGELLLRDRLIDRPTIEWALREQVLRRLVALADLGVSDAAMGPPTEVVAGFEVPLAAVLWRLGRPRTAPVPDEGHLHVDAWTRAWWRLFDPTGALGTALPRVVAGAPLADLDRSEDTPSPVLPLVAHLLAAGLATVAAAPPTFAAAVAPEGAALAAWADGVAARHRLWADASHYTVLGLGDEADPEQVEAAMLSALAAWDPAGLPPGVDGATRQRCQELRARILAAARVLGDSARRAVYDARLRGPSGHRALAASAEGTPLLLADRARRLLERGQAVVAAGMLARAAEGLPDDPDVLALLGRARHAACPEDPDAGESELRRALALDPGDLHARYALAAVLRARGADEEARAQLTDARRRGGPSAVGGPPGPLESPR